MSLAVFSYALAAVALFLLAMASRGRDGPPGVPGIAVPALASALWAAVLAMQAPLSLPPGVIGLAELGRNLVWFWYLWRNIQSLRQGAAGSDDLGFLGRALRPLAVIAAVLHAVHWMWPSESMAYWVHAVLPIVLAVTGLVLVEQFYRNAPEQARWSIKPMCIALAGAFAYDVYLYSEAALFHAYDAEVWSARGLVNALLVPLIWISLKRRITTDLKMAVSHRMAFHTVALLGTGAYLVMMAAAGYYLRMVGGDWGRILQTVFLFAAVLALSLVVASGTARARLRVFLSKHFFRYRYDYREEWLRFTAMLTAGEPGSQLYERVLQAMARLVESNGAALWLGGESGPYRRVAHWNLPEVQGETPMDSAFARFLQERNWVLDLDELRARPDAMPEAALPDWLLSNRAAWLVVPLSWQNRLLGFMVLNPSLGKVSFNWEVSDLLKTAACQATAHLAQARAAEALTVARQFESFNRASAFVVHDIKNLVAQLSLLLSNAAKHKHKPEFQEDMLATIESSVARMNRMLAKLREEPQHGDRQRVEMDAVLGEVMRAKSGFSLKPQLEIQYPGLVVSADAEKLARVIGHVVQNAIEATPYTGRVGVTLFREDAQAVVRVVDTGAGMDAAFIRDRLFSPFISTKGTGMGVGAYECREYIYELGGQVDVVSQPGQGTRFTLRIPLMDDLHNTRSPYPDE